MSDPITTPSGYDVYVVDGFLVSPGVTKIKSGGGKGVEIQDMGQPLTLGKNTIQRSIKNTTVTYEHRLWTTDDFTAWATFEAMLREGQERYPNPRSYLFADFRVPWLTKAVCEEIGPLITIARGGPWAHEVTWHQWRRIRQAGGPVVAPKNAVEKQIEALSAENKALENQLAAAQAAGRKGK